MKKLKQKVSECTCGSRELAIIYLRAYACALDVLQGDFVPIYKWLCKNCESEWHCDPVHEDEWRSRFAEIVKK